MTPNLLPLSQWPVTEPQVVPLESTPKSPDCVNHSLISFYLRLDPPSILFPTDFTDRSCTWIYHVPDVYYISGPNNLPWLDHPNEICIKLKVMVTRYVIISSVLQSLLLRSKFCPQ